MDLLNLLKKLKNIEANPQYVRSSRRMILGTLPTARPMSVGAFLLQSFQTGSTIALAGILLLLIVGGFSVGQLLTPFRLSSLNPKSLEAEAHAIDIQIKLTDLNYQESTTAAAPKGAKRAQPLLSVSSTSTIDEETENEIRKEAQELGLRVASSSEDVGIDEALKQLSE